MVLARPCLDCGALVRGSARCVPCSAQHQAARGTTTARGYGGDWQQIRRLILDRDGHTCWWCGGHATTVDHLRPLARGGPRLDPANLAACCAGCNSSKSDRARPGRRRG